VTICGRLALICMGNALLGFRLRAVDFRVFWAVEGVLKSIDGRSNGLGELGRRRVVEECGTFCRALLGAPLRPVVRVCWVVDGAHGGASIAIVRVSFTPVPESTGFASGRRRR
jgi:hypothetical protein